MAESMSRLQNPRRPEPKMAEKAPPSVDTGEQPQGDPQREAAEKMHAAEPGAKHMIASHDGYALKTHSIDEQGQHEGPHEDEEAHAHMQRFMGEEQPQKTDGGMEPEENQSLY